MASPVDTSVKHFLSTMANAPTLSGTAGSLIALLDALLVTGFDIKTLTSLTVAGGVATAAFTGVHSAIVDSVIQVAGVTGGPSGFAGHNGEQKVTAAAAGAVKYATTLPDGTYTGTITIKMAPAGWEKPFTFTNGAVYRSLDPAGNRHYLRVDDTNAQFARVVGYESMSDGNTGTGPFPTAAQMNGGGYWPKSLNANSAAVAWSVAADSRIFYISTQGGYSSNALWQVGSVRAFGDAVALRPAGDAFSTILNYSNTSAVASMVDACLSTTFQSRIASPRNYTGLGSAVLQDLYLWGTNATTNINSGVEGSHGAFPNRVDGALYTLKKRVSAGSNVGEPRADVPGLYHIPQSGVWDSIRSGDKVPGTGTLAGRNLMGVHGSAGAGLNSSSTSTNTTVLLVDVTGPWR